ncbi:MAG: hypothetical protein ABFD50_12490 [Smithella sp.]
MKRCLFLTLLVICITIGFLPISVLAAESDPIYSIYNDSKNAALDYLATHLAEDCPIASYETDNMYIKNTAFSYDNALAALAFTAEDQKEKTAEVLDAFVNGIENDRYQSDRVRNAYMKGDSTGLPGWWVGKWNEDAYQVGTNVGNSSFVALALLQFHRRWGSEEYLQTAVTIMDWVLGNCQDNTNGFTAGYDGWPENGVVTTYTYKSTEHNIDAYAVFRQLYALTGEVKYKDACESALQFIRSMYDGTGYFYTGTTIDGITPSKSNIALDTQIWPVLALGDDFSPYRNTVDTVLSMKTVEGGYPFHKANTNGGFWCEGTAFAALAFRKLGMDIEAVSALDALTKVQLDSGGFPAATVASLTTGESWTYSSDPHIAPTTWYVMAVNGFNPYEF